ncbi:MAG: hypothetical protein K6G30_06860 [Acetatifactor sp.]|nr:hypothetical protein [Acetatifactor sp.]
MAETDKHQLGSRINPAVLGTAVRTEEETETSGSVSDGDLLIIICYSDYDKDDNLLRYSEQDTSGTEFYSQVYEYRTDGTVLKCTTYYDGRISGTSVYDLEENEVESDSYSYYFDDESICSEYNYYCFYNETTYNWCEDFDENGILVSYSESEYAADGSNWRAIYYLNGQLGYYNREGANGKPIENSSYYESGKCRSKDITTWISETAGIEMLTGYFESGNIQYESKYNVSWIADEEEGWYYPETGSLILYKRYDENGNIVYSTP